jgi:hypothetical protein
MIARTPKKSTPAKKTGVAPATGKAARPATKKAARKTTRSAASKASNPAREPASKATKTSARPAARKSGATTSGRESNASKRSAGKKPVLLSGGNPQIPKGEGDAPVQAYIDAIPDWKQDIARRIDRIVERTVPNVQKAVKWNSPFYGLDGKTWFLSLHCFTRYLKVTFFRGTSLRPVPPGESKTKETRYLDIPEEGFDEKQFADWVKQASQLPGERM